MEELQAQQFKTAFKKVKNQLQRVKTNYTALHKHLNSKDAFTDEDMEMLINLNYKVSTVMEKLIVLKSKSAKFSDNYEAKLASLVDVCKNILKRIEKDMSIAMHNPDDEFNEVYSK